MDKVISRDGTPIAYDRVGSGEPIILVDGAFCSRSFGPMSKLAPLLASDFTVIYCDRRGRGDSGDSPSYAVEREIEDLAALVEVAGGSASLYGVSSGAVLAVRAAAAGLNVRKLALYEPPLVMADSPPPVQPDLKAEIIRLVAEGKRGAAVSAFMKMVGMPPIFMPMMRLMPGVWSGLTRVAHTLPYDFAVLGDTGAGRPLPAELAAAMAAVHAPTLVMAGGKSPKWMHHAVDVVTRGIPGAERRTVPGQTHDVKAKAIAPELLEFFGARVASHVA
jgi:pimeloyl-ACP methyl ester carboxylesterase